MIDFRISHQPAQKVGCTSLLACMEELDFLKGAGGVQFKTCNLTQNQKTQLSQLIKTKVDDAANPEKVFEKLRKQGMTVVNARKEAKRLTAKCPKLGNAFTTMMHAECCAPKRGKVLIKLGKAGSPDLRMTVLGEWAGDVVEREVEEKAANGKLIVTKAGNGRKMRAMFRPLKILALIAPDLAKRECGPLHLPRANKVLSLRHSGQARLYASFLEKSICCYNNGGSKTKGLSKADAKQEREEIKKRSQESWDKVRTTAQDDNALDQNAVGRSGDALCNLEGKQLPASHQGSLKDFLQAKKLPTAGHLTPDGE